MAKQERTEKPTGKRRAEARKKGQVARSVEVNSTVVLLAAVAGLGVAGPGMLLGLMGVLTHGLRQSGDPTAATAGLSGVTGWALHSLFTIIAPVALLCLGGGLVANVAQVRLRFSTQALRPQFSRLNPINGVKRVFGKDGAVEAAKAIAKTVLIGGVAFLSLWPKLPQMGALVGVTPWAMLSTIAGIVFSVTIKTGGALVVLAAVDYAWQRHRHEESLKMTKDEVKQEGRQQDIAPEIKGAIRRKQLEQAKKRMLAEVPTADVVVVNPTHYAVALRYDGKTPAPEVVAKGVDHVAAAIRRVAEEHGVPIVSNPPLARTIYREVELGEMIPEGLYAAVAEVLAFVFRMARRRGVARRALAS